MLHHAIRGPADGAVVLLLHGFLGSHRNLGALVREWSAAAGGWRLVSADLPGHGDSPPLPPDAGLETMASAVLELLDHLGCPAPTPVVGHSLGGRVALMARRLAPGSVAPIALLDITPSPITQTGDTKRTLLGTGALLDAPARADTREAMRSALSSRGVPGPIVEWLLMNVTRSSAGDFEWRIDRAALAELDARASPEDLWDAVDDTITCIRGGASPYVSDEDVARFETVGATVHTIDGAGHFVHVDATADVVRLLSESVGRE